MNELYFLFFVLLIIFFKFLDLKAIILICILVFLFLNKNKVDKKINKIGDGSKLEKFPINKLPQFLQDNLINYQDWID